MLVKFFGLGKIESLELSHSITEALVRLEGVKSEEVTVRYSPVRVTGESGKITVLVTGPDAFGRERRIIAAVGEVCEQWYAKQGLVFPGVSNPSLPNQK